MDLRQLRSRDELLGVVGSSDAFARYDQPAALQGWALGEAVAILRTATWRPPALFAWGHHVGPLLDALTESGHLAGVGGISVPYEDRAEIDRRFEVTGGGDWMWMWTDRVTGPLPGSESVVEFDDVRDAARLAAFSAENPSAEGKPGTGISNLWLGITDDTGEILAVGARQRLPSGVSHLAGILVTAPARGRGLGKLVSAALTDRAVAEDGVCTLGMYRGNAAAGATYASLGYVADKGWASRQIAGPLPRAH